MCAIHQSGESPDDIIAIIGNLLNDLMVKIIQICPFLLSESDTTGKPYNHVQEKEGKG